MKKVKEDELENGESTGEKGETVMKKVKKSSKKLDKKSSKKLDKKKSNKKDKKDMRGKFGRPVCKTGQFKTIRHLLESMFTKKEGLTKDEGDAAVKKHFPTSRWVTFGSQWGSYYNRIHQHREFTTIDPPKWTKGAMAKIKAPKTSKKK